MTGYVVREATEADLDAIAGFEIDIARISFSEDAITDPAYDALTQPWLQTAADALAMTITAATALLDLDVVVLDGSISRRLLQQLLLQTRKALEAYPLVGIVRPSRLEIGQVGAHARALGGALLPLHIQFFPDKDIFLKQDL